MSDTEKYEVHPGISGYPAQEEAKFEVHPEIQQAQPPTEEQQLEAHESEQSTAEQPEKIEEKEFRSDNNEARQSWHNLRKEKERAEYERDFLLKQLQQYENSRIQHSPNDAKIREPEEDYSLSGNPDDLAEIKQLHQVDKKYDKRIRELEQQLIESKILRQYPDFDKVVTAQNIDQLRRLYPEIAANLNANADLYTKSVSAYTMIKKLGIEPQEDLYELDRQRAQRNAAKPRPLASISPQKAETPLSHANAFAQGLTPELSKNLWKEMKESMKNN